MRPHERLEREWAAFNDLDPAGMVACSSGTAALHLALEAFQLPSDSEVIVPDFTMVACPRAVMMAGLRPVFVDCYAHNLNLSKGNIAEACNVADEMRSKVVMPVHVYGRDCDVENVVRDWAELWKLMVVEDLSEIHGVRPHNFTDAACWSFYKNKIVAGEEGGAVWFRDPTHAKLARQLRSLGFTDAHDYRHVPRGHNYRMSDAHAKIILDSTTNRWGCLQEIEDNLKRRREIESWYDEYCPTEWRQPARDAVWVYDFRVPNLCESTQDEIVRRLRWSGIEARHGFKPMHAQDEFKSCRRVGGENAERASREVIYLPVSPGVTTRESCRRAFEIVESIIRR